MARPRRVNPIILDDLRVVDRNKLLTMPLDELDTFLEKCEVNYKDKEEEERKYKETRKIEFFEPIEPYQTKILEYLHAGKKTITLQGANRIGKTTLGAVIVVAACLGIQPWDGKELPVPLNKPPIKARIICEDWEDHAKGVIIPELKKWLPAGEYTTTKNNLSVDSIFHFKNVSTIELMTNRQDTEQHESWYGHIVWADEPTSYEKYVANIRGLIDFGGIFLLTMTAVRESWVLDQIILNTHPSFASVTEIPITANPHLSKDQIERFSSSIRETDRVARLQGGWLNLVGLVWPGFKPDVHIIDDFKIPTDWPVVPFIDFHPAKPQAIGFYSTDPQERWYVIDEEWKHFSPEETADYIIRQKISNGWRIEEAFIDPISKGDTAYMKNRWGDKPDSFNIIKERLWRHGIELSSFSRDKSSGILNIEKLLMGPNKMPLLFFFRSLTNKIKDEGHIWEIQRWIYDEDGKPKDENDHFMQCLYAMSLSGIKYSKLITGSRTTDINFDVFEPNYGIKEAENEFSVFG